MDASRSLTTSWESLCDFQHLLESFQTVKAEPVETKAEPEDLQFKKIELNTTQKTSRKAKQTLNKKSKKSALDNKKQIRMQKNRESAQKSRERAKAHRIELETKVSDLMKQQKELEQSLFQAQLENASLQALKQEYLNFIIPATSQTLPLEAPVQQMDFSADTFEEVICETGKLPHQPIYTTYAQITFDKKI